MVLPGLVGGLLLGQGGGGSSGIPAAMSPDKLVGWWDTQDTALMGQDTVGGTAVAVGDPVGAWTDKTGHGYTLTNTGTARPLLQEDMNGKKYLSCDGSNDFLNYAGGALGCATAIGVAYVTGGSGYAGLITNAISGGHVGWALIRNSTLSSWYISQGGTQGLHDASHVWNNQVQTANITMNDTRVYSADGTGHPASSLEFSNGVQIGRDRGFGRYLAMRLYGFALYNEILSDAERNAAEEYMMAEAGETI